MPTLVMNDYAVLIKAFGKKHLNAYLPFTINASQKRNQNLQEYVANIEKLVIWSAGEYLLEDVYIKIYNDLKNP